MKSARLAVGASHELLISNECAAVDFGWYMAWGINVGWLSSCKQCAKREG
jgi:hypothetical protein